MKTQNWKKSFSAQVSFWLTLVLLFPFVVYADPPTANVSINCQAQTLVSAQLGNICRQNAAALKKSRAEYEDLMKKKMESMQKSAAGFAATPNTTNAIETSKRMVSSIALEQEGMVAVIGKKREAVGTIQKNYDENIGKLTSANSALIREIDQKSQFLVTEKNKLRALQSDRDGDASAISAQQQKIAGVESQVSELNKKRTNFTSAIKAEQAAQEQTRILGQKFKVSEAEMKESAGKLRDQQAKLSGVSLESNSKISESETKLHDEVTSEKAKLAQMSATEGSKTFDSKGNPLPESGSQKGVRAALLAANEKDTMPDTTDAALANEGKQMAADGRASKYFSEDGGKSTEQMQAEQSLGTAKAAVARNEQGVAALGGEDKLAEKLKQSSKVYSGLEADVNGMPASDQESLAAAKADWNAQYKKDCENPAVCSALNSYGIKPEMTTSTGCSGSGICGAETKANTGLDTIAIPNGEKVVQTDGIATELRVASSQDNFSADASSRLKQMNADTMTSAERVKQNADLAARSQIEASSYGTKYDSSDCKYNPANSFCMNMQAEKTHFQDTTKQAEGQTVRWDAVSAGQVSALAKDPKVSAKIDENIKSAAALDASQASAGTALGFVPIAGSAYGVGEAKENLTIANAAVMRTKGTSDVASNNLVEAKAELSSAKTMAAVDVATSGVGGGIIHGAEKAAVKVTENSAVRATEIATPLLTKADNAAEVAVRDVKVSSVRAVEDSAPAVKYTAANQNEIKAAQVKATAFEDTRINALKAQSNNAADVKIAQSNSTAESLRVSRQAEAVQARSEVKAAAFEDTRVNALKAQSNDAAAVQAAERSSTAESLRLSRQTEATQAQAEVKAAAFEDTRVNALKSQSSDAADRQLAQSNSTAEGLRVARQSEAVQAKAEIKATAFEDTRVNALQSQSKSAADVTAAQRSSTAESLRFSRQTESLRARAQAKANAFEDARISGLKADSQRAADSKATQINTASEDLRMSRQLGATQAATTKASADRAAQAEANALKRQTEASAVATPRAKAAMVSNTPLDGEIVNVPELLSKQGVAHTPINADLALITPSAETKVGRAAAKVEQKYGAKVYVDQSVDDLGYAGQADAKTMDLSSRVMRPENHVDQGPVIAHEIEHVKNQSTLAKRVDQGQDQFDWRNINFGSEAKPTMVKDYPRMGIDEVPATRRTYNSARFEAAATAKKGDQATASLSREISANAVNQGKTFQNASSQYLASAGNQLEDMSAARLSSRQTIDRSGTLPSGAPAREAGVRSVAVKQISDSSGRSVSLVKTTYKDSREHTSLFMKAEGESGVVPMDMTVPNNLMDMPDKMVVNEAKKYVTEAQGKMETYGLLYDQSATRTDALAYRGNRKLASEAVDGAKAETKTVAKDAAKDDGNWIGKADPNAKKPFVDSNWIGKRAEGHENIVVGPESDPNWAGKTAEVHNSSFTPLQLQEAADRRVDWVVKQHSEFTAITPEDNRNFMELAAKSARGEGKESFFVTENAVLKRLNDDVVKDKDFVTALDNLHKDVLLREIKKDPILSKAVVGSYNDYKSVAFALDRNTPNVRRLLEAKITKVNEGFNEFLTKVEKAKGWKEKSIGISNDMRTWHHSGIGDTFQEAGLAARRSRDLALKSGKSELVSFADQSEHYIAATDRMSARSEIIAEHFKASGITEATPHGTALSEDAIETIRKAKPAGKTSADLDAAVQTAVKKRYGQEITSQEASLLRAQIKDIDAVNPSLLIEKRVEINMGKHDEGVVSFDFKGQNSRNLYQTQMAILKTKGKGITERLEAISEGDRIATAQLDGMKARVEKSVASLGEKFTGKDVASEVQKSGDDGVFLPLTQMGDAEKARLAKALNENKVGEAVRVTYLPKHYRDSNVPIPVGDRNRLVVEAEKIEKDLFNEHLVGQLPEEVFKGLQVKVDLVPAQTGRSAVGISFAHATGKAIPKEAEEIARAALKDKYDISFIDRGSDLGKGVTKPARSTASEIRESGFFGLKKDVEKVKKGKILAQEKKGLTALEKEGVSVERMEDANTYAGKLYKAKALTIEPDAAGEVYLGSPQRITGLPEPVKKADGNTPFYLHPDFSKTLEEVRAEGGDVVFDFSSTLLGTDAYYSPSTKLIAMAPYNSWAVFKHELQHLQFDNRIAPIWEKLSKAPLEGKRLAEVLSPEQIKKIGAERLGQIQKYVDESRPFSGNNSLPLDEFLATSDEAAEIKGWSRYFPLSRANRAMNSAQIYQLQHQIEGLQSLSQLTPTQKKLMTQYKARILTLTYADQVKAAGLTIGALKGAICLNKEECRENISSYIDSYREWMYEPKSGVYLGRRPDGKGWDLLH